MDKTFLVTQLVEKLKALLTHSAQNADATREEAKTGASRAVNLAKATAQRAHVARAALDALENFRAKPLLRGQPIGLGALVELQSDTSGKTLFLAPAGAGEELTGPDGDGFFHVVTPISPIGRALLGRRVGDVVETTVDGELTEWTITEAA
jgi:transcription elongation GreA/GreB family factor